MVISSAGPTVRPHRRWYQSRRSGSSTKSLGVGGHQDAALDNLNGTALDNINIGVSVKLQTLMCRSRRYHRFDEGIC